LSLHQGHEAYVQLGTSLRTSSLSYCHSFILLSHEPFCSQYRMFGLRNMSEFLSRDKERNLIPHEAAKAVLPSYCTDIMIHRLVP